MDESSLSAAIDAPENGELTPEEVEEINEPDQIIETVNYSGTDFDVEGLVRRLNRGDIVIPSFGHGDPSLEVAGFQRGFVWRRPQMDRFIESLLLGFPIPGIILVQQVDKRYLVLDGQQRLRTLQSFYSGIHQGKEFALENVANEFKQLTYRTLSTELRRQLDNTFIQATIVKTDGSRASLESIYQVFERLNSGGTQLTPHEIRIALYPGRFVDLLAQMNDLPEWRSLYGAKSQRLRDQELILRILALYMRPGKYFRPLKKFLNEFLGDNRELEVLPVDELNKLFRKAAGLLFEAEGKNALRVQSSQVNAAFTEAFFVALMKSLASGREITARQVKSAHQKLVNDSAMAAAISGSTATEEYVKARLSIAQRILDGTRRR
jgi:Protein of unknown function DUF262